MDELTKEQAALYALGVLTPAETETLRAQCATDVELQFEADAFAAIVEELALYATAVAPAPALRDQLMARIAETPQESYSAQPVTERQLATVRADEGQWTPLAPHVFCKTLHRDVLSQMVTSLIKLEPGGYLPRHRHLGTEQTFIVAGDCLINGETFYAGDFRIRPAGTEDSAVSTVHGTTILMIAPEHFEILDTGWAC